MREEKKQSFMIILLSGISTNFSVFWIEQPSNWDWVKSKRYEDKSYNMQMQWERASQGLTV